VACSEGVYSHSLRKAEENHVLKDTVLKSIVIPLKYSGNFMIYHV
jgi:hypothetical protein